jgi:Rps23 Pro-64 3,4-dihydroxylase Tpa1-like proline 4-hydroxylase
MVIIMIKEVFGDYIWKSKLDNNFVEEYKNEFNSRIIDNNSITTDSWDNCSVRSSFFNNELVLNCLSVDFNGIFSKKILDEMKFFFTELEKLDENRNRIDVELIISKIWYNKYNYGDFQEIHDHSGQGDGMRSFYSFVYIFKSTNKKSDAKLVFDNPRGSFFRNMAISEIVKISNYDSKYIPGLNEGELIIFPSHMKHYVSCHKNKDDNRITISGNISTY